MRLFIALPLPANVTAALERIEQGVPAARWVPAENMHLTLRFIGEADGGAFEDLVEALAEVVVEPFTLEIAGVGHFERRLMPTTLWAGVVASSPLLHLQRKIERACRNAGFPPEGRKFAPHVTLARLRKGDVLTHCFRPFPGAPAHYDGRVREEGLDARERGVIFDVGHGGGSFGWKTAEDMLANDFKPDCISSDVHSLSIEGPAYDQLVTMSKFLRLGMSDVEVIKASTVGPANAISRPELGALVVGTPGDASVLSVEDGDFTLRDVKGLERQAGQHFRAHGMVMRGAWRSTLPPIA